MTSSEVLLLQRELHKLAEQNREDHKLVRQALTRLQGDLSALSDRLHDVEDTDKQVAAIEQDREDRRKRTLGLGTLAHGAEHHAHAVVSPQGRLVPREGAGHARGERSGKGARRSSSEVACRRRSRSAPRPVLTAVCYNDGVPFQGVRR